MLEEKIRFRNFLGKLTILISTLIMVLIVNSLIMSNIFYIKIVSIILLIFASMAIPIAILSISKKQ